MEKNKLRLLVVEDEKKLCDMIAKSLHQAGYEVDTCNDGEEALDMIYAEMYDLIVLDLNLPGMDGMDILRELRKENEETKVLILSARSQIADKVDGLDAGANDYMEKPFDSKELVARAKAVLRRYKPSNAPTENPNDKCVEYADLTINLTNYSVIYMGHTVEMPPKELELLYFLASSPNHVFTREQLLDQIWGYEYIGDTRTVDVHIKRLREKIKDHANWKISTIWGIGYKFEVRN